VVDEAQLLRRAAGGDSTAMASLIDRHGRYLYGIAHAMTRSAHDAEDAVQETFIAALSGKFRSDSSLKTWLVKILVRRVAMQRRSDKRREAHVKLAAPDAAPVHDRRAGGATGVEASLDLSAMLAELSEDHRTVIVLRELEGLSYDEIAEALDGPVGTVESRLYRAREDLRRKFSDYMKSV
jgi:RNA polymerase sigma-70 factor (ECF subfamily)